MSGDDSLTSTASPKWVTTDLTDRLNVILQADIGGTKREGARFHRRHR
jgi:hypothetical protein